MAISRKPKKQNEEHNDEMIFEEPIAQQFDVPESEKNAGESDIDKRFEELQRQYETLQAQLNSKDSELEYLRAPDFRSQITDREPQYDDPNSVKLPDAAIDPDGYAVALEKRQDIKLANQRKRDEWQRKQEKDIDDKVASLWDAFADEYPDIAENQERVEFVAQQVATAAAKAGKDVQKYMFVTRKSFMRDVAKKYEEVFGAREEVDEDIDDRSSRRTRRSRSRDGDRAEEDNGRSTGIFGGSTGAGGRRTQSEDGDRKSMIDDIQELQRKTGFF